MSAPGPPGTSMSAPGSPGTTTSASDPQGMTMSAPGPPGTTRSAPGSPGSTTSTPGSPGTTTSDPGPTGTTTSAPGRPGPTVTAPRLSGTTTSRLRSTRPRAWSLNKHRTVLDRHHHSNVLKPDPTIDAEQCYGLCTEKLCLSCKTLKSVTSPSKICLSLMCGFIHCHKKSAFCKS